MSEKTWIDHREDAGYDFTPLVQAMNKLEIRPVEGCIVVDASAITEDEHTPTTHMLFPSNEGEGQWTHGGSGEVAPLVEHLFVIALLNVEDWHQPEREVLGKR